jgi:hypothetical protein
MSTIPETLPEIPVSPAAPPAYTLFDSRAVALATFLGTPVAGACLMAVNDRRLGRAGRAAVFLVAGIAVTAVAILIGWNSPGGVTGGISLILLIGMQRFAARVQGEAVKVHMARGGRLGSNWAAAGVGLAWLIPLFGVVYTTLYLPEYKFEHGPKVVFGSRDEVYYMGAATQTEAQSLGNVLKSNGYFLDKGVTVLLDKTAGGTVLSFVVKEGIWDKPDMVASFDEMGREIAPSVGGFPIEVHLIDKKRAVKNQTSVGQVSAGNDHVYFMGTATDVQARALAKALAADGFFDGTGIDVFFSRQSDGTALSFVVKDGAWDDAGMVASFEKIARDVAPTVGGVPLHLHFDNTNLDVKKDMALN